MISVDFKKPQWWKDLSINEYKLLALESAIAVMKSSTMDQIFTHEVSNVDDTYNEYLEAVLKDMIHILMAKKSYDASKYDDIQHVSFLEEVPLYLGPSGNKFQNPKAIKIDDICGKTHIMLILHSIFVSEKYYFRVLTSKRKTFVIEVFDHDGMKVTEAEVGNEVYSYEKKIKSINKWLVSYLEHAREI